MFRPNYRNSALGSSAAIDYLLDISIPTIAAHNRKVSDLLRNGLTDRGVQILSPEDPGERSAILAARFEGDNKEIAQGLNSNDVFVSYRNGFIRFSPHIFNGQDDITKALDVIDQITS
jgi:selenocysteine lyase/cysteine desulfurase